MILNIEKHLEQNEKMWYILGQIAISFKSHVNTLKLRKNHTDSLAKMVHEVFPIYCLYTGNITQ